MRRKLFRLRLPVGLGIAFVGIGMVSPTPFFGEQYRVAHSMALLLILAGLALRAWGAGSAGDHTRSDMIEAPRLATSGPFAYVRNPIYSGSICMGFGMALLIGDPWAFLLTTMAFALLFFSIVPAEEEFLARQFGDEYARYRAAVPRFIPRLRPWPGGVRRPFQWRAIRGEFHLAVLLVGIYLALFFDEHLERLGGS